MGLVEAEKYCALYNREESKHIKDNASDFGHKGGSSWGLQMSLIALGTRKAAIFMRTSSIPTEGVAKSPFDTMSLLRSMLK